MGAPHSQRPPQMHTEVKGGTVGASKSKASIEKQNPKLHRALDFENFTPGYSRVKSQNQKAHHKWFNVNILGLSTRPWTGMEIWIAKSCLQSAICWLQLRISARVTQQLCLGYRILRSFLAGFVYAPSTFTIPFSSDRFRQFLTL